MATQNTLYSESSLFYQHGISCQYSQEIPKPESKRKFKRLDSTSYSRNRSAANSRERRRMQCLNEAFEGLRTHIPRLPYEKRLSKVDTLRLAICYIKFLNDLITTDKKKCENEDGYPHSNSRKIVIYNTKKENANDNGIPILRGHSLSWKNEEDKSDQKIIRTRKVWTPAFS